MFPCVQVHKEIILFPVLHLLDIELMEEKECLHFSNEHLTLSIYFIKILLLAGIRRTQLNPAAGVHR